MKLLKKTTLFTLGLGTSIDLNQQRFEFTYGQLYKLVPFEPVSIRGAIMSLKEESALSVYQRQGQTRIQITSIGIELLKASFPALKHTPGKKDRVWTICVFTGPNEKAKTGASAFRGVRDELLRLGFFALERGVYALPAPAPAILAEWLSQMHMLHRVFIFESHRMVIGDERAIIRSLFDIRSLTREGENVEKTLIAIDRKLNEGGKLHPKTSQSFIDLLPDLMKYLANDLNVPDLYFPQEIRLSDIKQLLFRVGAEILPKL